MSDQRDQQDFYVGYLPKAPDSISRTVRRAVIILSILCLTIATLTAASFAPGAASFWAETPNTRAGIFIRAPYPMLLTAGDTKGSVRCILLVSPGKCGVLPRGGYCGPADTLAGVEQHLKALDAQPTEVRGTLLTRDHHEMIELENGAASISPASGERWRDLPGGRPQPIPQGPRTIRGTIVDPKCYMGAMKPGEGNIHRDCAVRCISGGIPPVLITWDSGKPEYYILTSASGAECNDQTLPFVGDEVEVTGESSTLGDLQLLRIHKINRL